MSSKKVVNRFKSFWKKFWHLLWKDDSFKGWIFSIVFLFLFIKFIFFPSLSLVTGTSLPLAIVESCSMYHQGNLLSDFDEWFDRHEDKYEGFTINKLDFQDFPMRNGFNKGDILFVTGANPDKLEEGDIIIFKATGANPVIHRIVDINEAQNGEKTFSTIGDNNFQQAPFETEITEEQLVGKASLKLVPYGGWIKLIFFEWQKPEDQRGFCQER